MKSLKITGMLVLVFVLLFSMSIAAKEEVDLNMWTFVEAHNDYYELKAEEFNEDNDDYNINLEIETYPYQEMHDQLQIALQTGIDAPDLVDIEIRYFPQYTSMSDVPLVEITDLIDKHRENIIESRLAPYSKENSVYGVPTHLGAMVAYYNKELIEKAGYSVDDIQTWEDFRKIGKEVTKDKDGDGEIDQWMLGVETADRWTFHAVSRQWGSNAFDQDGNVVIDREENVKALKMLQEFLHEDEIATPVPGGDLETPAFYENMSEGTYAAILRPQWYMIRMTEFMPDLEGKILVRPLPAFEEGGTRSGIGGGTGTAITNMIDESKITAAKEYLEFAKLTREANIDIWTEFGFDPFRSDVYEEEELYNRLPYFGNERVMDTIKGIIDNEEIQPLYLTDDFTRSDDMIDEEVLPRVLETGEDPKAVLKEIGDRLRN